MEINIAILFGVIYYHTPVAGERFDMTSGEEQRQVILALGKSFAQCTDFDLWGQPIEAIDGYKR